MKSFRPALGFILLLIVVGTAGYMLLEGWTVIEALWMVAVTLSTIGYGIPHDLSTGGMVFTIVLILSWFGLGSYALSSLTAAVLEGDFIRAIRRRSKERVMRRLRDHFIVVGYGRLGRVVVQELLQMGAKVCVLEKDPALVAELEAMGDVPVVHGQGADESALRQAGIEQARGVALALPSAAEAVYVSMVVRQVKPSLLVVTRVDEAGASERARKVGADQVVNPYRLAGWRIAHGLVRPTASGFLDLATRSDRDDLMMDELPVPAHSPVVGRNLAQLQVGSSHGILVIAIHKSDGRMITTPGASELVDAGDVLVLIGRPDRLQAFIRSVDSRRS